MTLKEEHTRYLERLRALDAAEAEAKAKLAQAISEARKTRSLADIAEELGVSRQRIHQMTDRKDKR